MKVGWAHDQTLSEMVLRFDLEEFLELFINLIPWLLSERGRTNVQ